MKNAVACLTAVLLALSVSFAGSAGQQKHAGFVATELLSQWDDLNQQMIYRRATVHPGHPALYVVDSQGRENQFIDMLKDFPGALDGSVVSAVGAPDGGIVASCTLRYSSGPLKELILTYDRSGRLTNIIDFFPYETSALAVDEQGNIYSFAARTDLDPDDPYSIYPTIVKYDPQGRKLQTMLASSNFAHGETPTGSGHEFGSPLLRVTPSGIGVFAAETGKWFLLSQKGEIIATANLASIVQQIAKQYKSRRAYVFNSYMDEKGGLVLGMRLVNTPADKKNLPPETILIQDTLIKTDPANATFTELKQDTRVGKGRLAGVDRDGSPVYELMPADGSVSFQKAPF